MTGFGLAAFFAVGLAFLSDTRFGGFFAAFFLTVLAFLATVVFLRGIALVTGGFLRLVLLLAFVLFAITTYPNARRNFLETGEPRRLTAASMPSWR